MHAFIANVVCCLHEDLCKLSNVQCGPVDAFKNDQCGPVDAFNWIWAVRNAERTEGSDAILDIIC